MVIEGSKIRFLYALLIQIYLNSGEIEKELKDYCENHVRRYF